MATRLFYCPDCDGDGAFLHSPSGHRNDPAAYDAACSRCDGRGRLALDPAHDDTDGLRPYTPSKRLALRDHLRIRHACAVAVDPLNEMARCRRDARLAWRYADARRRAMKPCALRQRIRTTDEFMADVVNPILYRYVGAQA